MAKDRFKARGQPSVNVPTIYVTVHFASAYGALASLLCGTTGDTDTLVCKRVELYSYGKGLAASFFGLRTRQPVDFMQSKCWTYRGA